MWRNVRLAALGAMASALAAGTAAEERDCLELPKDEQPFCWMMQSCASIDDAERRQECFDSVIARYQGESTPGDSESAVETAQREPAEPVQEPRPAAQPTPIVQAESAEQADPTEDERPAAPVAPALPAPQGEAAREGERPWWRRVLRKPWPTRDRRAAEPERVPESEPSVAVSDVGETTVERKVLDIPKRFTARVTDVRALLHDRQLLVLDAKLLFETERASHSRIKPGDSVKVTRTSELFGERYSIVGGSGGAVRASRLRCESDDRGPETERKCRVLARAARTASD